MIKTLIFDIGGVVTHTDFDLLYTNFAKRIGVDPKHVVDYHKKNFKSLILGDLLFEDFLQEMRKVGGNIQLDFKKIWSEEAFKSRDVNEELLNLIIQMRKHYSVGVLSNLTESRFIVDQDIGLYDYFDYSILSFKEHIKKPDTEFYNMALRVAGVKPEEAVFVDDTEVCLPPATQLGMKTVLYVDNGKLREDLQGMGVIV